MATNNIPTNSADFIGLAKKMIAGVVQQGSTVPVTMVTAAQLQADLNVFKKADGDFNAARSARLEASDLFQKEMVAVYEWLLAVSNVLVPRFGTRWSSAWALAGFINRSTGIPGKTEQRLGLLGSLIQFFTDNPSYEVPTMGLTAAQGTTLQTAALKKQQDLTDEEVAINRIGDDWTTGYDALAAVMRALIKKLEGKLAKDDPRWLAFGLNMPATSSTPGQPQNLTAHTDETGAIVVQCDALALATRFRWRMRIVGVEEKYALAASTTEPMASIDGVAAGQTVQIIVQGVNGTSQGVASEPVVFTVPVAASVPKQAGYRNVSTKNEEVPAAAHEGNGNGHGQSRSARVA